MPGHAPGDRLPVTPGRPGPQGGRRHGLERRRAAGPDRDLPGGLMDQRAQPVGGAGAREPGAAASSGVVAGRRSDRRRTARRRAGPGPGRRAARRRGPCRPGVALTIRSAVRHRAPPGRSGGAERLPDRRRPGPAQLRAAVGSAGDHLDRRGAGLGQGQADRPGRAAGPEDDAAAAGRVEPVVAPQGVEEPGAVGAVALQLPAVRRRRPADGVDDAQAGRRRARAGPARRPRPPCAAWSPRGRPGRGPAWRRPRPPPCPAGTGNAT